MPKTSFIVSLFLTMLCSVSHVAAQHPIDVERKTAAGSYLQALVDYDKMPSRIKTSQTIMAAGRSAWALGLQDRASKEFDLALRDEKLSRSDRAQLYLSRGIIEYQEGHSQLAAFYAEKAENLITASPGLAAKIYTLWGDALMDLSSPGAAESKYLEAYASASTDEKSEIAYRLGICRIRLGKIEDAESDFQKVSVESERTPSTIRYLATLALEAKKYDQVAFWLDRGRTHYPQNFLDSWTDYAMLLVAASKEDRLSMQNIREAAEKKYPPSDPWLVLLQAEAEAQVWKGKRHE